MRLPSPDTLIDSAANGFDFLFAGGPADLTPLPSKVIDEGPQRTLRRYRPRKRDAAARAPVLLVPPLAAPASCFDLRRGCSLAEHLTAAGYPTYLVDYGPISFEERRLGLEHWVDEVLPDTLRTVADDAGERVQPVGWCLGGLLLLLSVAADESLPVASISLIASPIDFEQVRLLAPIRRLSALTGGALGTALYRTLGGAPAPLVVAGFRLTAFDRYLTRPLFVAQNLGNRERLAQLQAVDAYMAHMLAYPGRTFGQLYHAFFRDNDLAAGEVRLGSDRISLAKVKMPVLSVAGTGDVLAPQPAVHYAGEVLTGAPEVRLESAPGGHLGVLTGPAASRTTWTYLDDFLRVHDPHSNGD